MKNNISLALSQIYEKHLHNGRIAIYTKINDFKAGELDLTDSTFYCAPRTSKNIMRMFNGLGINCDIITRYDFKFIFIPFNNTKLKTTRLKWLHHGIVSPFGNSKVDKQLILRLTDINLLETQYQPLNQPNEQLSLFGRAS